MQLTDQRRCRMHLFLVAENLLTAKLSMTSRNVAFIQFLLMKLLTVPIKSLLMSLVIRYVDNQFCIQERFMKFISCDTGITGAALKDKILYLNL